MNNGDANGTSGRDGCAFPAAVEMSVSGQAKHNKWLQSVIDEIGIDELAERLIAGWEEDGLPDSVQPTEERAGPETSVNR